jgi:hypothetical protein
VPRTPKPVQADKRRKPRKRQSSPTAAKETAIPVDPKTADIAPFFTLFAGPWPVEVHLADDDQTDRSFIDDGLDIIQIDRGVHDHMRLQRILSLLAYRWMSAFGVPETPRAWEDFAGCFASSVLRDFVRCGLLNVAKQHPVCPLVPPMFGAATAAEQDILANYEYRMEGKAGGGKAAR